MKRKEHYDLVYLESISFYFDERSGSFYGSLRNGNQEETLPDFHIDYFIKEWNSTEDTEKSFLYPISTEDYHCVLNYIKRVYPNNIPLRNYQ